MFREMSETEITIRGIENVRMLSIYELTGMKDDSSQSGCAAISVLYGKEDSINLCELDEGFELLADRVFELYGEIKDTSDAYIDDRTRKILESGLHARDDGFLEKYYSMTPADMPAMAFESKLSQRILPIAEYVMTGLYRMLGVKYEITQSNPGWRGASVIYGMLGGTRNISGVRIFQNSKEEYEVRINNFIEQKNVLNINISMVKDIIIITYFCEHDSIHGVGTYKLGAGEYTETYETFKDGKLIFRDSKTVQNENEIALTDDERKLIFWGNDAGRAVLLPWGMLYLLQSAQNDTEHCITEEYKSGYLFRKSLYFEGRSYTRITNKDMKVSVSTTSVRALRMITTGGRLQTYFVPGMGNNKSRYKKHLMGRYFLHECSVV